MEFKRIIRYNREIFFSDDYINFIMNREDDRELVRCSSSAIEVVKDCYNCYHYTLPPIIKDGNDYKLLFVRYDREILIRALTFKAMTAMVEAMKHDNAREIEGYIDIALNYYNSLDIDIPPLAWHNELVEIGYAISEELANSTGELRYIAIRYVFAKEWNAIRQEENKSLVELGEEYEEKARHNAKVREFEHGLFLEYLEYAKNNNIDTSSFIVPKDKITECALGIIEN